MRPPGIEPGSVVPQTTVLSVKLWARHKTQNSKLKTKNHNLNLKTKINKVYSTINQVIIRCMSLVIKPIKTDKFYLGDDLFAFLDKHLTDVREKDIVVVTSKIVALAEKRVVKKKAGTKAEKHALVRKEADYFLPAEKSQYNFMLTIKDGTLAVNAGIDESNIGKDHYLLLPKDPYASAKEIWRYLKKRFNLNQVGVVITDSVSMPLRWGVFGNSLAHCGFQAIVDHVGEKDLFGRKMRVTKINLPLSIAQAAVFAMGEVDEARPIALVRGVETITRIDFQNRPPTKAEIKKIYVSLEEDLYAPVLKAVEWEKGG